MAKKKSTKMTQSRLEGFLPQGTLIMRRKKKKSASPQAQSSLESIAKKMGLNTKTFPYKEENPCARCKLHKTRTHIVFGEGNPKAEMMFIGEAPGESEDLEARPFVGRAGKLLDKMIEAMGIQRSDVYIANIVKCRPPENRPPEEDEKTACTPYLLDQIAAVSPKVIIALGKTAAQGLLQTDTPITELRGVLHDFQGTKLLPTYHPAYLLRNPSAKKEVWKDLQVAMKFLGWK